MLAKIIRAWKKMIKRARSEQNLVSKLEEHYANQQYRKSFYSLFAYMSQRSDKKEQYDELFSRIATIPLKKAFKGWFKASVYHGALRLFAHLYTRLQTRMFLKRIYLKRYKQDMIVSSLQNNHTYHLQRIYFKILQRYTEYISFIIKLTFTGKMEDLDSCIELISRTNSLRL